MTDYVFKYTDASVNSFAVKPYTANGPQSPSTTTMYTNAISGVHAVSADTPFVIAGKGIVDYGQLVQNNIIYLAENFCNNVRPAIPLKGMLWYKNSTHTDPTHPTDPVAGGLYVWNGSAWKLTFVDGLISTNLNMGGHRIINVGDAQSGTDALNTTIANTKYLQLTGGTISGALVVGPSGSITLSNVPTAPSDVTNKQYVDAANLVLQNAIALGDNTLQTDIDAISQQLPSFYPNTGGTISGDVAISGNVTLVGSGSLVLSAGTGLFDVSNRRIANVGAPTFAHDAAHKAYVDSTIATAINNLSIPVAGGNDGVVSSGTLNTTTGVLSLTRTQGLAPINVTGLFANKAHTHTFTSQDITHNPTVTTSSTLFGEMGAVINSVNDALLVVDRVLRSMISSPTRTVIQQTVFGNTTFDFGAQYTYEVWSDRMQIHMNGVKQYADVRAETSIMFQPAGFNTQVGLLPQTYTQGITVDGTLYTLSVVVPPSMTYDELHSAVTNAVVAAGAPVSCMLRQLSGSVMVTFVSFGSGAGHTVLLETTAGQLFPSIAVAQPQVVEAGQTLAYAESGVPGGEASVVQFHVAPPVGSLLEVLITGVGIADL